MDAIFLKLVNMSITASWIVLGVLVLRFLLKKAPKAITCALWALVAIRLMFPISFESMLSLIPSAETVPQEIVYAAEPVIDSGVTIINQTVNPIITDTFAPAKELTSVNPIQIFLAVAANVWIFGMIAMALYAGISYLRLRKKVAEAVEPQKGIWLCDHVDTPFILGIFRPRIYLPSAMGAKDTTYVLAHERAHLKRHDHWWKPLGFVLLTVYWFNPVLWVAYILLCRDIELACDERVIREMDVEDKKAYIAALLNCSVPRRMIAACPLAFGEVGVKARIKNALHYKKPAFWIIVVAVIASIVFAVCFLTDPKNEDTVDFEYAVTFVQNKSSIVGSNSLEKYRRRQELFGNPLQKFVSREELDAFKAEISDLFTFDETFNGFPSFGSVAEKYDANFFTDNVLFVWCVEATSGICRYTVENVERSGEKFTINIAVENAIEVNDYRDWFVVIEVKKEAIEGCTDFAVQTYVDGVLSDRKIPYYSAEFAYAGVTDDPAIYTDALNSKKMFADGGHLPIHKFENTAELEAFQTKFTDELSLTEGHGDMPSFADVTAAYDDAFFEDYMLFAIYRRTESSNDRYFVYSTYIENSSLTVRVKQLTYGDIWDDSGLFILVAIDNKYAPYLKEFNSYLVFEGCTNATFLYETAVAHAGYIRNDAIFADALNSDKMDDADVEHLPIRKFESLAELEKFQSDFADDIAKRAYGEVPCFDVVAKQYDADFFAEKTLFIVYVEAGSGSCRYDVGSVVFDDRNLTIHAELTRSPRTADMEGWFLCVAVDKDSVKDCTAFDADLNAISNAHKLIGKWETVATQMGILDADAPKTVEYSYTFFADGTGIQTTGEDASEFTYTTEGRLLRLCFPRDNGIDNVITYVYTVNGNILTLADEIAADRSGTLTKVPIDDETVNITEQPSGTLTVRFFNERNLPAEPEVVDSFSYRFEKKGEYSLAHCRHTDYLDNGVLSKADNGDFVFSFNIYQDALPYVEPLYAILSSIVTVDYEGNRFDTLALADEHVTITLNGETATLSEVRLGAGNGHRDFYFTFSIDTEVSMKKIKSFSIAIQ